MTDKQSIPDDSESYVCSDCGIDVSVDDEVCPKCGADLSEIEEDDEEEGVESTTANKDSAISDFLSFRKMVSNQIIRLLYFLGVIALTIGGIGGIASGDDEGVVIGLLALTVGNLL